MNVMVCAETACRRGKRRALIPYRRSYVYVRVDDYFGVDIVAELAGTWQAKHGIDTPGLLKDLDLLYNKDGAKYAAGQMYYRDGQGELQPLEYSTPGGTKPCNSKAALSEALYHDPALRAYLVGEVYEAIKSENSVESIMAALRAGTLRMSGSEPVPVDAEEAFLEAVEEFEEEFLEEETEAVDF